MANHEVTIEQYVLDKCCEDEAAVVCGSVIGKLFLLSVQKLQQLYYGKMFGEMFRSKLNDRRGMMKSRFTTLISPHLIYDLGYA